MATQWFSLGFWKSRMALSHANSFCDFCTNGIVNQYSLIFSRIILLLGRSDAIAPPKTQKPGFFKKTRFLLAREIQNNAMPLFFLFS